MNILWILLNNKNNLFKTAMEATRNGVNRVVNGGNIAVY